MTHSSATSSTAFSSPNADTAFAQSALGLQLRKVLNEGSWVVYVELKRSRYFRALRFLPSGSDNVRNDVEQDANAQTNVNVENDH